MVPINSLDEILDDICIEAEDLGDIHAIIYHYNKQLSKEQLNQTTFEVLETALEKHIVGVARDLDPKTKKFVELDWSIPKTIAFVKQEWDKIGIDNTDRFYCLWIIPKISAAAFKKIIAKTAMDEWQIISLGIEKLVYSASSINPGLTFIYKEEGEEGKPTIETWKSGKFITRQTFEK